MSWWLGLEQFSYGFGVVASGIRQSNDVARGVRD